MILFSVTLFFFACNSDNDKVEIIEGGYFETSDIANYLPSNYKMDKTYVIFKNKVGDELKLFIRYVNPVATSSFNNKEKFTFEEQNVALYNLETNERVIQILGIVGFDQDRRIVKLINCSLMPMNLSGSCFIYINLINGEVDFSHPNGYEKEKSYLDKKFKDVFVGVNNFATPYSEVAYSKHEGVVAFKDENAEYWIFDRFENN